MISHSIQKLGIIAGGGSFPKVLADACSAQGIDVFVVGFEGQTEDALLQSQNHLKAKLGQVGKIIKAFQKQGIHDLVMIGSIARPSFSELIPDLKAAKFLASHGMKAMGDSDLLSALRVFLEDEGFTLHGIQKFVPDLLTPNGVLTKAKPSKDDWIDIKHGVDIVTGMAALDIGQAIIVQEGLVLGVEAIEGTSALIERCAALKRRGRKGVLVKLCKQQQDTSLDLPTIGLKTIQAIHEAGFGGIAVHAQKSLMSDQEELVSFANAHNLYIIGIDPDDL